MISVVARSKASPLLLGMLAVVAALGLTFSTAPRAEARGVWCAGDPAIIVNGSIVDVNVHVPLARLWDIAYVDVTFHVPSNASVTGTINDSVLFKANVYVRKDLPASYGLTGTPVTVDVKVVHKGAAFDIGATTVATGSGTRVWVGGNTKQTMRLTAWGLLGVRLF